MNVADLVHQLDARPNGDGWSAKCPAHDDRTPSLSISEGADSRILLKCHAGCGTEEIVAALGLKLSDLFASNGSTVPPRARSSARIVATYDYPDANGKLLFQTVRYEPKDFRQRRPDGHGGWTWKLDGIEPVLFRLPEVSKDVREGLPIFICEGEKDVLRIVDHGFTATCNPMGAKKWRDSYSETLCGADVIIIADKDKKGRDHAQFVASKLHGIAKFVRVIELPVVNELPVKDPADFFTAGGTADQLQKLVDSTPEWTPPNAETVQQVAPDKAALPPVQDLGVLLKEPIILPGDVIEGMLSHGGKMVLGGGSKSFKTWQLIDVGLAVNSGTEFLGFATKKGRVLYINLELQEAHFSWRVKAVADKKSISIEGGSFDVWNLRGYAKDLRLLLPDIIAQAGEDKYLLIILDPIYKVLGQREENVAHHVTGLMNDLEKIAVQSGAAIAFGAHFSKGNQATKESIDRIGGSGAFGRDPDSILTFTRHEEEDAFAVEAMLRNHPPILPFVVRWQFPLMVRDEDVDPQRLKQTRGAPRKATLNQVLALLNEKPLRATAWQELASEKLGIGSSTFYSMRKELEKLGCVFQAAGLYTPK
jgi:hypothetical protein